jgi:hypothetical protein
MSNLVDNIDKVHEQLISEEGINFADLPEEIRKRIKGWNLLLARLQKNPEDNKLFTTLQKQSIEIADKIQDFIEQDFDEDNDDNGADDNGADDNGADDKGDANKKPEENKAPVEKKATAVPKSNEPKRFGNLIMEKKILTAMNGGDRISMNQLEEIIGKEPDYPEQEVHNIRLRKVFLSSSYRLV